MVLLAATFEIRPVFFASLRLAGRDQLSEPGRYAVLALWLPNIWSGSRRWSTIVDKQVDRGHAQRNRRSRRGCGRDVT